LFCLPHWSPPTSTLFPYTTLFRSFNYQFKAAHSGENHPATSCRGEEARMSLQNLSIKRKLTLITMLTSSIALILSAASFLIYDRSEEHTSELQSRSDLVCRLLLEK